MTKAGRWSEEDNADLRRMKTANYPVDVIANRLDRTYNAVVERWRWINKCEDKKQERRESINLDRHLRNGYVSSPSRGHGGYATTAGRPSADLIAEAQRRLYAPRTISQQLLGDPAPGYSALDRKRENISEPHHVDRRSARLGPKPTLAGVPA